MYNKVIIQSRLELNIYYKQPRLWLVERQRSATVWQSYYASRENLYIFKYLVTICCDIIVSTVMCFDKIIYIQYTCFQLYMYIYIFPVPIFAELNFSPFSFSIAAYTPTNPHPYPRSPYAVYVPCNQVVFNSFFFPAVPILNTFLGNCSAGFLLVCPYHYSCFSLRNIKLKFEHPFASDKYRFSFLLFQKSFTNFFEKSISTARYVSFNREFFTKTYQNHNS